MHIYDFFISPLHIHLAFTLLHCYPSAVFFFYIWNVTFKLLAKELIGLFPVQCTNFIKKMQ